MLGTFAKAIAAFFTAGVVSALATYVQFWSGSAPLPPNFWQTAVAALVGGIVAALGVAQVRNAMTSDQIKTAIKEGDVHPSIVASVAATTTPAPKAP